MRFLNSDLPLENLREGIPNQLNEKFTDNVKCKQGKNIEKSWIATGYLDNQF